MKWPWSRPKPEDVAPQPVEEAPPPPAYISGRDLDLEEQMTATSNVMSARDAANVFLGIVASHRENDHDCPPYCVPPQLAYFLGLMDENDLRMMLTVMLKDMVETYLEQQAENLGEQ